MHISWDNNLGSYCYYLPQMGIIFLAVLFGEGVFNE